MDILFPRLSAGKTFRILRTIAFGALVGAIYGALHDQISYAISREYFTRMKFQQFVYADFGWPERLFAAEVGVLATWWVGLLAGWILGRVGYGSLPEKEATRCVLTAFAILVGIAVFSGILGILLGIYETQGDGVKSWNDWRDDLFLIHVREFAIVAYLHAASYLGALLGLAAALFYLIRCSRRERIQ